jgi:hypothetical protein
MTDPLPVTEGLPQEDLPEPAGAVEVLPTSTPMRIDLYDVYTVRREMCALYRDMRRGVIKTQDGTRMAYVLDIIRKTHETCLMQDRLEALEQLLNARKERCHARR